ncbi:MAG: low temperature requirement protein A [Actinomycetota bacterium]|nr:low temperature requirement protein A [Actinomycetota bacterium]
MASLARFLEPPRLRTVEDADEERRATWLELFVDLVFVVAVGQVAHELEVDHTALGFLKFAGLFVPIWWAWVGFTFYADRFDTDDLVFRVAMFAEMLAVAALASTTPDALHGGSEGYVVAFVAVRAVLIALYLRARRHVPEARGLTTLYAGVFSAAAGSWLLSLLVPTPARYAVWAVALAVDLATPLAARRLIQQAPISTSHIPERIGLFTIIVLGEAVIAVVVGTAGADWNRHALVAAVGGFAVACAIWWLYFDALDASLVKRSVWAGQLYLYMHLPLLGGLVAAGAGVELAIHDAAEGGLTVGSRWALCGGVAVALTAMAVIHFAATRAARERDLWLRIGVAAAMIAIATTAAPVLVTVPLLVALLAVLVLVELGHEEHAPKAAGLELH